MRIGVIGAGAAGLCAIKHAISFSCEVVAFEQSDVIGGTWVYTDEIGKDKYGNDIHSSMYKGLHTNLPKELMLFPDLPFPPQEKSFVSANDVNNYLKLYADTFNLRGHIKFQHHVLRLRPVPDTSTWEVTVINYSERKYEKYVFDAVLVCNGHFSTPSNPQLEGRDVFKGQQMHSHDYKVPTVFANKRVLVIGGGPSGIDISQEISQYAEKVFWSNHISPAKQVPGENLVQKTDIEKLTADGADFMDGSSETFDEIIYCTGYKYTYPFLSADCGISCDHNYIRPLYKHCLSINHSTLALIGLPFYVCPFQMFDLQIKFCLTFMTRRNQLPSKQEMIEDTNREMNGRWVRGLAKNKAHSMGHGHQDKYYADLAEAAKITPIKPVMLKMYDENRRNQQLDFANYRRMQFTVLDDENFVTKLLP